MNPTIWKKKLKALSLIFLNIFIFIKTSFYFSFSPFSYKLFLPLFITPICELLPPIEAGASCFNKNSALFPKKQNRLTLSPQAYISVVPTVFYFRQFALLLHEYLLRRFYLYRDEFCNSDNPIRERTNFLFLRFYNRIHDKVDC